MIAAYFQSPERGTDGLDGTDHPLLVRFEIDRGFWNMTLTGYFPIAISNLDQWWRLPTTLHCFATLAVHIGQRRAMRLDL